MARTRKSVAKGASFRPAKSMIKPIRAGGTAQLKLPKMPGMKPRKSRSY